MSQILKLAIIYIRVSSKKQFNEGHSPESQEKVCQEFALAKGYKVLKVFIEPGFTGRSKLIERKVGREVIQFVSTQPGITIIVNDFSRASRKLKDHYEDVETLEALGCKIVSATQYFGEGLEAEYAKDNLILAGQLLAGINRKEVIRKMTSRAEAGFYQFNPPFGYKFEKTAEGKKLVFKEPEATILRDCFDTFALKQIWTNRDFQNALKLRGYTKSRTTVDKILRNPIYAGMLQVKGENIQIPLMKGRHEPLITLETFEAIQAHIDGKVRQPYRTANELKFELKGFAKCAKCEKMLVCSFSKGKKQYYGYYVCKNRSCELHNKGYLREKLEEGFKNYLAENYRLDKASEMALQLFFIDYLNELSKDNKVSLEWLKKQYKEVSESIQAYLGRIRQATPVSVLEIYETEIDRLQKEKAKLEIQISGYEVQKEKDLQVYQTRVLEVIEGHRHVINMWDSLSVEQKRGLIKLAFNGEILVNENGVYQTPQVSLLYQLFSLQNNKNTQVVDVTHTKSNTILNLIDALHDFFRSASLTTLSLNSS